MFNVYVSGSECHGTNLLYNISQDHQKTYPYVRYHGVEMKKVPFFPHFKVSAWN